MQMARRQRNMILRVRLHSQNKKMLPKCDTFSKRLLAGMHFRKVNSTDINDQLKKLRTTTTINGYIFSLITNFDSIHASLAFLRNDFKYLLHLGEFNCI